MVGNTPTAKDNIMRVLRWYGVADRVRISAEALDRIYCDPVGDGLVPWCEVRAANGEWIRDLTLAARHFHGADVVASYREGSGCHPALQVTVHRNRTLEIDLDFSAPVDVVDSIRHLAEVVHNGIRHSKTDQEKIAAMLDKRGITAAYEV